MKVIPHNEFWLALRMRLGDEQYREIVEVFRGEKNEVTLEEVERRFEKQGESIALGAELHGCACKRDIKLYYKELFRLAVQIYSAEKLASPDGNPTEIQNERFQQQVAQLNDTFDKLEMSHPSERGFVCYSKK